MQNMPKFPIVHNLLQMHKQGILKFCSFYSHYAYDRIETFFIISENQESVFDGKRRKNEKKKDDL